MAPPAGQAMLALVALTALTAPLAAQRRWCDPELRPADQSTLAYGPRGDRCEGLFIKDVAGTTLSILSLTAAFEEYDPASDPSLHLTWSARAGDSLRIQVRAVQPNLFFGMDTERPISTGSYEWPTGVLSTLNIRRADIGLLAWTLVKRPSRTLMVHVPVSVARGAGPVPITGYSLVVYPVMELREVYLTLGPADSTGQPIRSALIRNHVAQLQGYYPAERPIQLSLPALRTPGIYYLQVTGTLLDGTPVKADPMLFEGPVR